MHTVMGSGSKCKKTVV